jgi:hypothetical protein
MERLNRFPARVAKARVTLAPGRAEVWFQNEIQVEHLPRGSEGLTSRAAHDQRTHST